MLFVGAVGLCDHVLFAFFVISLGEGIAYLFWFSLVSLQASFVLPFGGVPAFFCLCSLHFGICGGVSPIVLGSRCF